MWVANIAGLLFGKGRFDGYQWDLLTAFRESCTLSGAGKFPDMNS